jgi:hypothetical protein
VADINHLDPPIKYRRDDRLVPLPEHPVEFRPETEPDPVDVAKKYVNHAWVQNLVPIRTQCIVCHKDSDIIHVPIGTIAFGNPNMLRRGSSHNKDRDITEDVARSFAKIGWKFQFKRAYCPSCKNLGAV